MLSCDVCAFLPVVELEIVVIAVFAHEMARSLPSTGRLQNKIIITLPIDVSY